MEVLRHRIDPLTDTAVVPPLDASHAGAPRLLIGAVAFAPTLVPIGTMLGYRLRRR
jgi:hypothetical protein